MESLLDKIKPENPLKDVMMCYDLEREKELIKKIEELEDLLVRAGEYLPKWMTPKDILEAIEKIKER